MSVHDAIAYCEWLSIQTGTTTRLPEESEWVYASRGGNKSQGYEYSGSNDIDEVAWYGRNLGNRAHAVGLKQPNELGICDMSRNVWELVVIYGMPCGGAHNISKIHSQIQHNIRGKCEPAFQYGATGLRAVMELTKSTMGNRFR